jgi:hypothetical protein
LWTEPAGNISEFDGEFVTAATFGEKAYTKIRYFVVVREMQGCCLCLPLHTYNFRGTGKDRIRIEDYAAVYPSGGKPIIQNDEQLVKDSFPIIIEDPQERLNPTSRLNFGRVYTVEHNIKVLKVGRIPSEFLPVLDKYFVKRITGSASDEPLLNEDRELSLTRPADRIRTPEYGSGPLAIPKSSFSDLGTSSSAITSQSSPPPSSTTGPYSTTISHSSFFPATSPPTGSTDMKSSYCNACFKHLVLNLANDNRDFPGTAFFNFWLES